MDDLVFLEDIITILDKWNLKEQIYKVNNQNQRNSGKSSLCGSIVQK